jgi:hypothetical protein
MVTEFKYVRIANWGLRNCVPRFIYSLKHWKSFFPLWQRFFFVKCALLNSRIQLEWCSVWSDRGYLTELKEFSGLLVLPWSSSPYKYEYSSVNYKAGRWLVPSQTESSCLLLGRPTFLWAMGLYSDILWAIHSCSNRNRCSCHLSLFSRILFSTLKMSKSLRIVLLHTKYKFL